jgi:hypothetical protein
LPTPEPPKPRTMLPESSTTTSHHVLAQEAAQKQLALFYIGLEMLGQKKKERFLSYLLSLKKPEPQTQEAPHEFQNRNA